MQKRPFDVQAITIDIKITDRHYNDHTATVEIADYETVEMFVKRVEVAIARVLKETS